MRSLLRGAGVRLSLGRTAAFDIRRPPAVVHWVHDGLPWSMRLVLRTTPWIVPSLSPDRFADRHKQNGPTIRTVGPSRQSCVVAEIEVEQRQTKSDHFCVGRNGGSVPVNGASILSGRTKALVFKHFCGHKWLCTGYGDTTCFIEPSDLELPGGFVCARTDNHALAGCAKNLSVTPPAPVAPMGVTVQDRLERVAQHHRCRIVLRACKKLSGPHLTALR